jgi:hypothetical protein
MPKKLTQAEFLAKAVAVHGVGRYDYSQTVYVRNAGKVKIICPEHGVFEQSAGRHAGGGGCPKCANEQTGLSQRLTTEGFIKRAIKVHGDKYDYSLSVYLTAKEKIKISCPVHGPFDQLPYTHIKGFGCAKCGFIITGVANRSNTDEFIARAKGVHNEKYDYSRVVYTGNSHPVKIICSEHGEFMQTPSNHLLGNGCARCARNQWDEQSFITKCQQLWPTLDFSKSLYTGLANKINFTCKVHGEQQRLASDLLFKGKECPSCGRARMPGWSRRSWVEAQRGRIANLYLIEFSGEAELFFKLGITFTSIATRFKRVQYKRKLLALYSSDDAGMIYDMEKKITRQIKHLRYMPLQHFGGKHECFSSADEILAIFPL